MALSFTGVAQPRSAQGAGAPDTTGRSGGAFRGTGLVRLRRSASAATSRVRAHRQRNCAVRTALAGAGGRRGARGRRGVHGPRPAGGRGRPRSRRGAARPARAVAATLRRATGRPAAGAPTTAPGCGSTRAATRPEPARVVAVVVLQQTVRLDLRGSRRDVRSDLADELGDDPRPGAHGLRLDRDLREAGERAHVAGCLLYTSDAADE